MGRTKKKKTVKSGPLVEVVCYSQAFPRDTKQERAIKTKSSSEARKRLNDIASWKKLERLICCNFLHGCYFVTLTYSDKRYIASERIAKDDVRQFIKRVRYHRKQEGDALSYIYVTEGKHGDHRLHHHLILNKASGDLLQELCALWPYGGVDIEGEIDVEFVANLSKYLTKERVHDGARAWTASRGLKRPMETSEFVNDRYANLAPPGAYIIESTSSVENSFGRYTYLKYLEPTARIKQ